MDQFHKINSQINTILSLIYKKHNNQKKRRKRPLSSLMYQLSSRQMTPKTIPPLIKVRCLKEMDRIKTAHQLTLDKHGMLQGLSMPIFLKKIGTRVSFWKNSHQQLIIYKNWARLLRIEINFCQLKCRWPGIGKNSMSFIVLSSKILIFTMRSQPERDNNKQQRNMNSYHLQSGVFVTN